MRGKESWGRGGGWRGHELKEEKKAGRGLGEERRVGDWLGFHGGFGFVSMQTLAFSLVWLTLANELRCRR